ncbi:MAG: hypothetical protein P8K68_00995 [Algibacter sp.]|uniref:hypothetical protein n=1 Tax=Algibacter sp. TaxID=1872428 RepID=UPI0026237C0A|nr:hypothetical protein [Algibacter sp.]MDG1729347.1 hypothetical protein [Algibacter sp.]MDG2177349.1 hypothetical protein [Algibacter sp.]
MAILNFEEKVDYLKKQLENIEDNYADSFKNDIFFFIYNFETSNPRLFFIKNISSKVEIDNWINKLTSRIVLKFDEEYETINDFIYDYIANG